MPALRTSCTHDCPDACGLLVTVEGSRVVRLQGDPDHPITRGFLCYRVGSHYIQRHHSPERLTTPLLREAGGFRPIGWDEALDLAADRLARIRDASGGAAILHVQGGGSLGILKNLNAAFSRLLGASETRGEVCDGAGTAANVLDFGAADANDPEQLLFARTIVLWGRNVAASSPHLTTLLKEARERGAQIWLIDPLPQRSRVLADRELRPRPGCDGALALALARVVLDSGGADPDLADFTEGADAYLELARSRSADAWAREADVPLGDVADLADRFACGGPGAPVTTLVGWGLQRRVNGAAQVRHIDALHALTGNLGRPGAGASFTTPRRRPFDLSYVERLAARVPRTLLLPLLGREIETATAPPVRAVLVDNGNPVATNPDSAATRRALESREFVMVLDAFLTDTARCAHLVLPSTLMLEEDDLVGSYGHHRVSASRAVVARLEGARTDLEIYQALAHRLGFGDALAGSPQQWMDRFVAPLAAHGIAREGLLARSHHDPNAPHVAFEGRRFKTPSGRFRFVDVHRPAPPTDPAFPLTLLGLSTGRWQASQLTDADEEREGPLVATMHPSVAGGVPDGGEALLESRLGAIPVVVRHDGAFRDDCVYVPRARSVRARRCVNLLVAARLTDHGESAAFYDEPVRVRRGDLHAARVR